MAARATERRAQGLDMDVRIHDRSEVAAIDTLEAHPRNPRDHTAEQVAEVAASMVEFGFTAPILVDEGNVILSGHGRWAAAKLLGLKQVPVRIIEGLTNEQKLAYVIADNQLALNATWNEDVLKADVSWLRDQNYELDVLGFGPSDIAKLLEPILDEATARAELVSEPPRNPATRRGDLWILGNHRLLCGDSTIAKDVEKVLAGAKPRMAFTDPPWNVAIGLDSNPRHRQRPGLKNDDMEQTDFDSFLASIALRLRAVVTGDVYVVMGHEQLSALDLTLRKNGFHWSSTITWVKDSFVLGRSKYHRRTEPIWYGWPEEGKSSFQNRRDLDDAWEFPRPRTSAEHPTMKPVALVQKAVEASSRSHEWVLDLFGGAGSTLIACEQSRRKCAMIEIDIRFVDVIVRRWQDFTGKVAVLDGGGTYEEVLAERKA